MSAIKDPLQGDGSTDPRQKQQVLHHDLMQIIGESRVDLDAWGAGEEVQRQVYVVGGEDGKFANPLVVDAKRLDELEVPPELLEDALLDYAMYAEALNRLLDDSEMIPFEKVLADAGVTEEELLEIIALSETIEIDDDDDEEEDLPW